MEMNNIIGLIFMGIGLYKGAWSGEYSIGTWYLAIAIILFIN